MKMQSVLCAVALLTSAISAQATTFDWGHHDSIEYGSVFNTPGTFEDFFAFNLTPLSDLASTSVSNNIPVITDITDGLVQLYQGSYWDSTADVLVGSYAFDGTTGSSPTLFTSLTSGDYYYRVTGLAIGTAGGFYTISSAPVPEPETYAMLLAGLGMTLLARKRKTKV